MPNISKFLSAGALLCSFLAVNACTAADEGETQDGNDLLGNHGDYGDHDDNDSCGCQSCGCDDDDDDDHDDGTSILEADVDIRLTGFGLAIGLDPACILSGGNLLSLEADLFAKATAEILGHELKLVKIDADDIEVELGNGCQCEGIEINACVAASLHVEVDADFDSCNQHCYGKGPSCMSSCNVAGNKLAIDIDLDASIVADIDINIGGPLKGLDHLLDKVLNIGDLKLFDKNGFPINL